VPTFSKTCMAYLPVNIFITELKFFLRLFQQYFLKNPFRCIIVPGSVFLDAKILKPDVLCFISFLSEINFLHMSLVTVIYMKDKILVIQCLRTNLTIVYWTDVLSHKINNVIIICFVFRFSFLCIWLVFVLYICSCALYLALFLLSQHLNKTYLIG
jgi:hypothetical protein